MSTVFHSTIINLFSNLQSRLIFGNCYIFTFCPAGEFYFSFMYTLVHKLVKSTQRKQCDKVKVAPPRKMKYTTTKK